MWCLCSCQPWSLWWFCPWWRMYLSCSRSCWWYAQSWTQLCWWWLWWCSWVFDRYAQTQPSAYSPDSMVIWWPRDPLCCHHHVIYHILSDQHGFPSYHKWRLENSSNLCDWFSQPLSGGLIRIFVGTCFHVSLEGATPTQVAQKKLVVDIGWSCFPD